MITKIENLPCKMTPQERALKSEQMAAKLDELNGIEAKKSAVTKQLGEDMKRVKAQLDSVGVEVRTGLEYRPIECTENPRYADGMVDLIRCDTGDVVRTRAMHPSERQEALDLREKEIKQAERTIRRGAARKNDDPEQPLPADEGH